MSSLRHIVFIEPGHPRILIWSRSGGAEWTEAVLDGLEAQVTLSAIGIDLPLAEIYDQIDFAGQASG
ncbi:MAG: hypothetical protein H7Y08_06185 [Rhizobiaceae bacterium]|nr:hypothetical protein [Rhizobiaceae bacterium]